MIEALWSMRVSINKAPVNAGGVVVIETGRIFGGDSAFIWVGEVTVEGGTGTARVKVRQYQAVDGMRSATGLTDYTATFKGAIARDVMRLTGHPDGYPALIIDVELTRQAELP